MARAHAATCGSLYRLPILPMTGPTSSVMPFTVLIFRIVAGWSIFHSRRLCLKTVYDVKIGSRNATPPNVFEIKMTPRL